MLRLEFNLVWQLRVLEQSLGHADTPRIADADDTGLGNHVTTCKHAGSNWQRVALSSLTLASAAK